jgi:hypothetical protein
VRATPPASRAQTAIRFALANPDISGVVVGLAELSHLEVALARISQTWKREGVLNGTGAARAAVKHGEGGCPPAANVRTSASERAMRRGFGYAGGSEGGALQVEVGEVVLGLVGER